MKHRKTHGKTRRRRQVDVLRDLLLVFAAWQWYFRLRVVVEEQYHTPTLCRRQALWALLGVIAMVVLMMSTRAATTHPIHLSRLSITLLLLIAVFFFPARTTPTLDSLRPVVHLSAV